MPNLIQIIKQAALEAVEASNPTKIVYGTVTKKSPIAIKIDQKFTLTSEFLVLTRNVSRHEAVMFFDGTEQSVVIDNTLNVGDKVVLLQEQGGQRYIVLDKVGE